MTALDEKWFPRIKEINAQLPQRLKVGNYTDAKNTFFSNDSVEPKFSFPNLSDSEYQNKFKQLAKLKNDINACSKTLETVKKLYNEKIYEKEQQLFLLQALGRNPLNQDEVATLVESIYGVPNQSVFNHLCNKIRVVFIDAETEYGDTQEYSVLKPLFLKDRPTEVIDLIPITPKQYESRIYTDAKEVRETLLEILPKIGLDHWRVQISCDSVGGFKVWPNTKRIIVPTSKMLKARKGERVLTENKLVAMIEHEIMTHALRVENGVNSQLQLLSIGLAHYWRGEEGIATYREQLVTGADDYINQNMHFAIGLAYGLDRGGKKRNFREVFEILVSYYVVCDVHDETSAADKAFAACERIFNYATGEGTAFVMTKDIAYREGNIAIHTLLNESPAFEECFNIGKFDPTNQQHVSALQSLGIISCDK